MSAYDMERLSVLIVDDSSFARTLLSRILRHLNVRQITTANDGADAVDIIKQVAKNPVKMGVQRFDLILSDWMMAPVNGAMFLKWVRRHKDSPNRFVPFVVISALAEQDVVNEARSLGANEFLAKPYSVKTMTDKLTTLINRPRNFIYTPTYFGPDRRRRQQPVDANRRTATKEQIGIIHDGKIPGAFKEGIKAYYIRVPNTLKSIVATGMGGEKEEGHFSAEALQSAEDTVLEIASDYADWVKESLGQLTHACAQLREQPKNHWKYFTVISNIAHELRGQGATFGYPLVTEFAKSLYNYTHINVTPDERFVSLIHSHIVSIQAVIRDRMQGDGGTVGKMIVETLNQAKSKYEEQRPS